MSLASTDNSAYATDASASSSESPSARRLLVRHQAAAAVGTAADFGAMIAGVQLLHLSPPIATLLSALVGGVVNFGASRFWAFDKSHSGSLGGQAWRYALAMVGGAALNAVVLSVVLSFVTMPYPFARAFVAVAVSLLYTYPVHTRIVFRVRREADVSRTPSWPSRPSAAT